MPDTGRAALTDLRAQPKSRYTAGMLLVCGIDEAGRGPIAGPVTAAVVAFLDGVIPAGLRDSKQLSPDRRAELEGLLRAGACFGLGWCWPAEIDSLNIHRATLVAMERAYRAFARRLSPAAGRRAQTLALVDGRFCPPLPIPTRAVVGGDRTIPQIQAASILAKTARDRFMTSYAQLDPRYGFDRHKGYPTAAHCRALHTAGRCFLHRRSFNGVP